MMKVVSFYTFSYCFFSVTLFLLSSSTPVTPSDSSDRIALLAIKSQINVDPFKVLTSWNTSIHHCSWHGITCSSRHFGRVTILELEKQNLQGTLSPYIGNLTFLKTINLLLNNFHGEIPQEIGRLSRLENLLLNNNTFTGEIPRNLSRCSELKVINLIDNKLSGEIFPEISYLSKLTRLGLAENGFTGNIPASLGNLSSLAVLSLKGNNLEGSIPSELCLIPNLIFFQLYTNRLTGKVPSCLYNSSVIESFSVAENQLEGTLPSDFGTHLPNLVEIYLGSNKFTGDIPVSLSNATSLQIIDFFENHFTGLLPSDLGRLQNLTDLIFNTNQLGTDSGNDLKFINTLTNCSMLETIEFERNHLKGPLPDSITSLSTKLININLAGNQIYGSIPVGFQNLINIESIYFQENSLSGNIPVTLGKLEKLIKINLGGNRLSGEIPLSLGNLSQLTDLNLGGNNLSGTIPSTLGKCRSMLLLNLSHNKLVSAIPPQVIGTTSLLYGLYLQNNHFNGSLPLQAGSLPNVVTLEVSNNHLSGQIPESLGYCLNLVNLSLDGNLFRGKIPQTMYRLRGLENLDLSRNQLSGEIPKYLELFPLSSLNLSFNLLQGLVPNKGIFQNASGVSVTGNRNLCGGISQLELPPCVTRREKSHIFTGMIIFMILGILCLLVLLCTFVVCLRRKISRGSSPTSTMFNKPYKVSYSELFRATNGFSSENMIGSGSYGSVFKGILDKIDKVVAVKVLHLHRQGAFKSFQTECNALRNLRHRNLVKLITTCSSIDSQGNDFKALVFDFMPNGSLQEWLHERYDEKEVASKKLNFKERLSIAIDVASALDYLHRHFECPIVHCDLKPSNILLDDDMIARVADFGIAKMFASASSDASESEVSSIVIKGSIGYVAPEYIMADRVSTQGDVYSYGILLLEMFTGKKPTDAIFVDGLCIRNYAETALHTSVMQIVDPMILLEENVKVLENVYEIDTKERLQECLVSMIRLGITCSTEVAAQRLTTKEVIHELHLIKSHYEVEHRGFPSCGYDEEGEQSPKRLNHCLLNSEELTADII